MVQRLPQCGRRLGLAAAVFGFVLVPGAPPLRAEGLPAGQLVAQAPRVSSAFLDEVRRQTIQLRLTPSQLNALLSRLSTMNYTQVDALAAGDGSALRAVFTDLQGPVGSVSSGGSASRGALTGAGVATGGGGSAGQQRFEDLRNMRGGFSDGGRGHASAAADCMACATPGTGQENDTTPTEGDGVKAISTLNGGKIYLYPDGSFVIQAKADDTSNQEVYDKNHQARTNDPRWTANKTPVPDGEGGQRSGLISKTEWRGLLARINSRGAPERSRSSAAGGTVVTTRTAAGTPVEVSTRSVVDVQQLQEILRIAAERFGPRLR
jgi:hypothetical protein